MLFALLDWIDARDPRFRLKLFYATDTAQDTLRRAVLHLRRRYPPLRKQESKKAPEPAPVVQRARISTSNEAFPWTREKSASEIAAEEKSVRDFFGLDS